jgi:hypothetical protein
MIYKGLKFRIAKNVIPFFSTFDNGDLNPYAKEFNYVSFGRITKVNSRVMTVPRSSICEDHRQANEMAVYESEKSIKIFVKPIKMKGYSTTNMAYGVDGKTYLMVDGKCYTRINRRKI